MTKNLRELALLLVFYLASYKFSNLLYLGTPTEIPATAMDRFWSFNPHWIWIYMSSYFSIPVFYLLYFNKHKKVFISSFLFLTIGSCAIFFLFPTFIPREAYLPSDLHPLYQFVFKILYVADGITNCLPSLHVSTAFICTWFIYFTRRKYFVLFFIYATLVAISTMAVKQHYFYDVIAGFLMSLISLWPILYFKPNFNSDHLESQ